MAISAVSKDFIVKHGIVVSTTATVLGTETSVSTSTGALVVSGGAGIAKDLWVGGDVRPENLFVPSTGVVGFLNDTGTNYVAFKSATTLTNTTIWELPSVDGESGQVLITDGSSKLNWADAPTNPYIPFPTGDYGLEEAYPGEAGAITDAFGVNLQMSFDAMYPSGAMRTQDLGVLT